MQRDQTIRRQDDGTLSSGAGRPGTTWAKDRNLLYIRIFWVSAIVLQVATAVALTRTTDRMAIGLLAIASAAALVTTLCLTARRPLPMPDATLKDRMWADPGAAAIKICVILALCMEALSTIVGAWIGAKSPGDVQRIALAVQPLSRLLWLFTIVASLIAIYRQLREWCCGGRSTPDGTEMPEYAALHSPETSRLISSEV